MTQQEQEQVSVADDNVFQYETIPVPELSKAEVKVQRLLSIKQSIEAKLQQLITEASRVRNMSSTAKTDYKRKFYEKKFTRVNKEVREQVLALQQIQYLIGKNSEGGDAANGNPSETTN